MLEVAISNRTRKMLWGRAAGRCAICNRPLVLDSSDAADREAVVGDECHIVSRQPGGPRANERPPSGIDEYDNLILLCKVDHKRVDDQPAYYTSERLRQVKADHERRFAQVGEPPAVRIVDDPAAGPMVVRLVGSGRELWNLIDGSDVWSYDHPDPADEAEAELLARLFDSIKDWGEIADALGPGEGVRAAFALGQELDELHDHGLLLYAARRRQLLTGGVGPPMPWHETLLRIVRETDLAGTAEGER